MSSFFSPEPNPLAGFLGLLALVGYARTWLYHRDEGLRACLAFLMSFVFAVVAATVSALRSVDFPFFAYVFIAAWCAFLAFKSLPAVEADDLVDEEAHA